MNEPLDEIQPAAVRWEQGRPRSTFFDDVYFSRDGGCDETGHVFLRHNRLPERWSSLEEKPFAIGETGFGTGLNFLAAADLWLHHAPESRRLCFISVEKFPLGIEDMRKIHRSWPQFAALSGELLDGYPPMTPGRHRLYLADERIELTLLLGDAAVMLQRIIDDGAVVDAWFLDGFAPAKNPRMWSPELFQAVAELSTRGTTFSTFTAAGAVRRGLSEVGFSVEKVPGYGGKRHMLRGVFTQPSDD